MPERVPDLKVEPVERSPPPISRDMPDGEVLAWLTRGAQPFTNADVPDPDDVSTGEARTQERAVWLLEHQLAAGSVGAPHCATFHNPREQFASGAVIVAQSRLAL